MKVDEYSRIERQTNAVRDKGDGAKDSKEILIKLLSARGCR